MKGICQWLKNPNPNAFLCQVLSFVPTAVKNLRVGRMTHPVLVWWGASPANSTKQESVSWVQFQVSHQLALKAPASCSFLWVPLLLRKLGHLKELVSEVPSIAKNKFGDSTHSSNPIPWLQAAPCSLKERHPQRPAPPTAGVLEPGITASPRSRRSPGVGSLSSGPHCLWINLCVFVSAFPLCNSK